MEEIRFTLDNKEYSNQELLLIGQEYYPKAFWIKRGIGLGLMLIGILCIIPLPFLFYFDPSSFPGGEVVLLYYKIGFSVSAAACLIPGIVVTAISFIPEKDITYIEYAKSHDIAFGPGRGSAAGLQLLYFHLQQKDHNQQSFLCF